MSAPTIPAVVPTAVHYPDDDGEPMADNTVQYEWIVTLKGNLDLLFKDRPDAFVAGNNLIYPVEGNPTVRQAPDVYVAFGRPKGDRGSYRVWEEGGVFPQIVFEIRSPGNRTGEMARKFLFYEEHGAQEYYDFDPMRSVLHAHVRAGDGLEEIAKSHGHVSPSLGIRFDLSGPELEIYGPDGRRFLTFLELGERAEQEHRRADRERERADEAGKRAEQERERAERERERAELERERADDAGKRAEQERERAERERERAELERERADDAGKRAEQERERAGRLAARLRELGVDPDAA